MLQTDVEKIIAHLPALWAWIFTFIRWTGCRKSNGLRLRHDQLDLRPGQESAVFTCDDARGLSTKGGNEIRVRLLPEAVEAVRCYPQVPGSPWVFPNPATGKPFNVDSDKMWWKARAAVGLNHVRVHDLRHALGQYLAEIGVAMVDIKEVLGHSSVMITERYYLQYSSRNSAERVFAAVTEARQREGLRRVK